MRNKPCLPMESLREWASVRWRRGLGAGSYQEILVAERNKPAAIRKSPFSGRAVFQEEPLSLRISPVHAADSGLYEAEFEDPEGGVSPRCFRVSVWGECRGLSALCPASPPASERVHPRRAPSAPPCGDPCPARGAGLVQPLAALHRARRRPRLLQLVLQRGRGGGAGAWAPAAPAGPWGCRPHRVRLQREQRGELELGQRQHLGSLPRRGRR